VARRRPNASAARGVGLLRGAVGPCEGQEGTCTPGGRCVGSPRPPADRAAEAHGEGELGAVSRAARRAARRRASVPVPAAMPVVPVPGEERARGEEGTAAAVDVAAADVPAAAGAAAAGASRRIDAPGKGGTAELPLADRSGIAAPSKVRAEDGAQRARGAQEVRPDDWTCESCGAHVFASKKSCYRCGAPRRRAGVTHSEEYRNAIPPLLREWGVDEALWSQVQDKTRLRKLAKDGDELNGRKRVASLRVKLGLE